MQEANVLEIAQAFSQLGQAALWLGESWEAPTDGDDIAIIASNDWIGVWSDSRNPTLAEEMERLWQDGGRPRQLVQVPDTLEEALGSSFRFSDFAPYMYLNGKGEADDPLDPITREDSRLDKIRQLGRAQGCVLLIEGATGCSEAIQTAIRAGRRAPDVRRIVLLGQDPGECEQELQSHHDQVTTLVAKMAAYPGSLVDLIRSALSLTVSTADEVVRVGDVDVPLSPLLRQEPPITQDYAVLRASDITPGEQEGEDPSQLLMSLLAGTALPWRSIARGFAWDGRPERMQWQKELSDAIRRIRHNENKIIVIDADVEPGSGATVLLCQLAVAAAVEGCPTLFHLASDSGLAYTRLRTFLTDLYRGVSGPNALCPTVIVFDADTFWSDIYGHLDSLPQRLNRDGRRAVIIRAHQTSGFWAESHRPRRSTAEISYVHMENPIRERLSTPDALNLAGWLERTYRTINDGDTLPSGWYRRFENLSREAGCPLLVAISLLLVERYRKAARLGDRLVSRIDRVVNALDTAHDTVPFSKEDKDGVSQSLRRMEIGFPLNADRETFYSLAIVLAAMGCLRTAIPRRVATRLAGVDPTEALNVIVMLERVGLVLSREPAQALPWVSSGGSYRTKPASVQLAHHAYGKLLLESLVHRDDATVQMNDIARSILSEARSTGSELGPKALQLLRPILSNLRPGNEDDREFGEQVVQRFLRVQRERDLNDDKNPLAADERIFRRWQWSRRREILAAYEWIPNELTRTSVSILHSRAITEAKCTLHETPEQARPLYMKAEDDLIAALEMDKEFHGDNPAFMLNTLGGVYVHWARMEREHGDPKGRVRELGELAEDTLREAQSKQLDSAYPAYYLALHKVETAKDLLTSNTSDDTEKAGVCLAKALELLSGEPEPSFRTQWNELFRKAVTFLGEQGWAVITSLKKEGKHLGWALEALHALNGEFPRERSPEIGESELSRAWELIEESFSSVRGEAPAITRLLRYCVFSVRELRLTEPAYDLRLKFLEPIVDSKYYRDEPVLQFDYGMLLFQTGRFNEGADIFTQLRRGQRFFYVPNDRSVTLSQAPNSLTPREFRMQVQNVDSRTGQGWARVGYPDKIPTPVPFGVRAFEGRGHRITPRAMIPCNITIRPAGPFAVPVIAKR